MSVIQAMLDDAREWDANALVPDVLRQDGGGGSGLAERMDRAVGAVRRARARGAHRSVGVDKRRGLPAPGQLELVSDAGLWKGEGNEHFRLGNMTEAVRSYTHAIDALHAVPSTDGSSSTLPPHVLILLATCLSNRAQSYLLLAEPDNSELNVVITAVAGGAEPRALARNAANDCDYGLHLARYSSADVPRRIVDKLQLRAQAAHRIIATHEPEPEPARVSTRPQPLAAPAPALLICTSCRVEKSKESYTKNQWKKRKFNTAKCKECVATPVHEWVADVEIAVEPEPEPEPEPQPEPEPLVLPAIIHGRLVGSCVRFPGDECPVCFEGWADDLADKNVIAFPCGHALCQLDLQEFWIQCAKPFRQATARGRLWTEWVCPTCRAPLDDKDPAKYGLSFNWPVGM